MLYTLIIIAVMYPGSQQGGVIEIKSIPGFTTEQACINAANKISLPGEQTVFTRAALSTRCVAMDV